MRETNYKSYKHFNHFSEHVEIHTLWTFFIENAEILSLMAHFLNGFTVSQFISKGCYLLCGHKFRLWFRMPRDVWKNYLVDGGSYFCVAFCSCFEIHGGGDTEGWNACMLNIPHKNVGWNRVPGQIRNISCISSTARFYPGILLSTKVKIKFIKRDVFILLSDLFLPYAMILWSLGA